MHRVYPLPSALSPAFRGDTGRGRHWESLTEALDLLHKSSEMNFSCRSRSAVPCFALSRQENFVRRTAVFESGTFLYPTYARGLLGDHYGHFPPATPDTFKKSHGFRWQSGTVRLSNSSMILVSLSAENLLFRRTSLPNVTRAGGL